MSIEALAITPFQCSKKTDIDANVENLEVTRKE